MFNKKVYTNRRKHLKEKVQSGVVLILGNAESPMNYLDNTFHFRQDSTFLYFFGLDYPNLAAIMDIDENKDYIFGDDVDLDDIIWMGPQASLKEKAYKVGIENTGPFNDIAVFLNKVIRQGRKIHFLPPYRAENIILLENILGIHSSQIKNYVSEKLIKAIVSLRSIKDEYEIAEIEKAIDIGYEMHVTAMKMAKPGIYEREIAGVIEGITISNGGMLSFPVILSQHGETLHNHYHGDILEAGKLMLTDAGAETEMHYASDFTRTIPVNGKFTERQKEIYEIVLKANMAAIKASKPGIPYLDIHLLACKTIASGLKDLGLIKGDVEEAVKQGAHAMFMPHGLGHMLGMDVHDMENLGEDYVGYNDEVHRIDQFGTAYLRLARKLQPNFVMTDEPGIYFIPSLIDKWRNEKKFTEFINYEKLETYKNFGGIRIEDDLIVTDNGCRVLGKPIPKTIADIEKTMAE